MRLSAPPGFSLRETVLSHGWHQLSPFRWEEASSSLWRTEPLSRGGTRLLRIRQPGGRGGGIAVTVLAGGEVLRAEDRRVLRGRLVRMLNLKLDLSDFYELCRREAALRHVPRTGAGRLLTSGNLYEDVFKAICCTNLSWRQAVGAVNRLAALGEPAAGTGWRGFPGPERILAAGAARISGISRLGYRIPYLMEWAGRARQGGPDYRAADRRELREGDLRSFLLSIPGIGPTSCRYLMMMWGHGGEIPVDSSTFRFLRETRLRGRGTPSLSGITRLYERFGAWKAYAYWFEFLPWARRRWSLGGGAR